MTSSHDLRNTVAFVTGASGGLGAAIAERFSARGAKVVLAARRSELTEEVADRIRAKGGTALAVACDVADNGSVEAAVSETLSRLGRVDHVINNAGTIDPIGALHETDAQAWARTLAVNLAGPYHVCRAALPAMLAAGGGTIVNISSGAAHAPFEGWSAYCATKAGLAMLTRSLIEEYSDRGIRVHGFIPGLVATDMQARIRASGVNQVSRFDPSMLSPPEHAANCVVYLCWPEAADIASGEQSIRDATLRARVGLPERASW